MINRTILSRGLAGALLPLILIASPTPTLAQGHDDVVDVARSAGAFETLLAAVETAGLTHTLQGDGPFTVFAPTDEAFAALPDGTVEALLMPENRDRLTAILTYHVVPGRVSAAQASRLSGAATVNGQRISISERGSTLRIDEATVVTADVGASNGVIHVIDSVLLPEEASIIGVARAAGSFGTLLAAVDAAGLTHDLMGEGPFTVFAPTDEAFADLPAGTVESLLEPANRSRLQEILTYHVVSGRLYGADLLEARSVSTLAGPSVDVRLAGGRVVAGGAEVVSANIDASNGVVHVIDAVLIPGASREASAAAAQLIERAISLGAPLFNSGDAEACADVYTVTAEALMRMESRLPSDVRDALSAAIRQAEHEGDPSERAWTLRRGLDTAYETLEASHGRMESTRAPRRSGGGSTSRT